MKAPQHASADIVGAIRKATPVVSRCRCCGFTANLYAWFAPIEPCSHCGNSKGNTRHHARWKMCRYRSPLRWFRLDRSLDERDGYWEVLDDA